jgi:ribosomal protein L18E
MTTKISSEVLDIIGLNEQEVKPIEPVQPGINPQPDEKDFNFWFKLEDMANSIPQGVVNSIEAQGDFLEENFIPLGGLEFGDNDGKLTFKDFIPKLVTPSKWKEQKYSKKRNLPQWHQPKTNAGQLTEGITRFLTGFAGPAKFLKGYNRLGSVKRSFIAGAYADLTVFDPNEGRLSDMLVELDSPVFNNAVTQYLASDEDDTEMEGRLKNVLEGMFLGGLIEVAVRGVRGTPKTIKEVTPYARSILHGIKGFKKMKATKNLDERAKIQKETSEVIDDVQKGKYTKRRKKAAFENHKSINLKEALKKIKASKENAKEASELWISRVINTGAFKNGEEVLQTIDNVADNAFDDVTKEYLENDVLKNQVAEELATILSRDKDEVLKTVFKEKDSKEGVVKILATKQVLQDLAADYVKIANKYVDEFGDDVAKWTKEAKEDVALRGQVIAETFYKTKEIIRGAARVTQAGRIKVTRSGGKILEIDKLVNIFKNYNANPAVLAKKVKKMEPKDVINEVSKSKFSKYIEAFNSFFINGLLGGTYTQAINILSNSYELFYKPLEVIAGATARADTRQIRLGFAQYQGMIFQISDTFKAISLAFRQGDAVLDPLQRTQDNLQIINNKAVRPISADALEISGRAGNAVDFIGKVVEFPVRLLMTGDEIFKQFNYRGRLYAEAVNNTLELGLDVGSKEGKANIKKIFDNGFDKNGKANVIDNDLAAKSLQNAREATFTNGLNDGRQLNIGMATQDFMRRVPALRFITPFIRTPTNLWRQFETRIPVWGAFTKPMKDAWNSGDPRARADVLGRQIFGTAAAVYAYNLATSDITDKDGNIYRRVTGQGPKDYSIRKQWEANGWQPYSIAEKQKDGSVVYKQYNRMDPRFYIFGVAGDVAENEANINDVEKENIIFIMITSVAKGILNKAYMRGLADAIEVISSDEPKKFERYAGRVIGNLIPYQAFVGQGVPGIIEAEKDDFEARGFVDEIIKKAPFIDKDENLEVRRDILTGEPVSKNPTSIYFSPTEGVMSLVTTTGPLMVGRRSKVLEDPVRVEIMRLRRRLSPPNKKIENIDLTKEVKNGQSAYNYLMERIGKTEINGINLYQTLSDLIQSEIYLTAQEGDENNSGGKEILIDKVFNRFKTQAKFEMIEEYNLSGKIEQAQEEKYELRLPGEGRDFIGGKEILPRRGN